MNSVENPELDNKGDVTFSFGHVVGAGIQAVLTGTPIEKIYWDSYITHWKVDFLDRNEKQNKSFALAMSAIEKFAAMASAGLLKGYEIATYKDKQAIELSFIVHLPNGFSYKGYADAILVHKETGKILVLECKTSSANFINAGMYKNSAQALGYSVVLDSVFPDTSSYDVMYLVYLTKQAKWNDPMMFTKDYKQRALWIREILLDMDIVTMYEEADIYPMHGESCNDFFRDCEYLGLCNLGTANLVKQLTVEQVAEIERHNAKDFEISLTLKQLIETQLAKSI